MTPGPTNIPDRVLAAMHRPAVDLVDTDFMALTESCFDDLAKVFRTDGRVFLYASNGHGAWEAALANLIGEGDLVLAPSTGMFSWAWGRLASDLGAEVEELEGDWRSAFDPGRIEERLRADPEHRIKAVLAVQTDTATSVTSDIAAVRRALDACGHPALLMADVVASLGTVDFRMDDWGVDVAVAGFVIVRDDGHLAAAQLLVVPFLPFVGAHRVGGGQQALLRQPIGVLLALDDPDHLLRLSAAKLRQVVQDCLDALEVPGPAVGFPGVGPALPDLFVRARWHQEPDHLEELSALGGPVIVGLVDGPALLQGERRFRGEAPGFGQSLDAAVIACEALDDALLGVDVEVGVAAWPVFVPGAPGEELALAVAGSLGYVGMGYELREKVLSHNKKPPIIGCKFFTPIARMAILTFVKGFV